MWRKCLEDMCSSAEEKAKWNEDARRKLAELEEYESDDDGDTEARRREIEAEIARYDEAMAMEMDEAAEEVDADVIQETKFNDKYSVAALN